MSRFGWYPAAKPDAVAPTSNAGELLRLIAGGTLNYGLGQTLPLFIGFLLIPVYTAILTPEDYGIIEMSSVLAAVLTVFMRLGVPGAVTRFYYEHSEGPGLRDYVTSIGWFLRGNALLVGALTLVGAYFFAPRLLPGLSFFPYIVLTVVTSMLATNSDLQRRLIQVRRQSSYSAMLSITNSLLSIALAIAFVVGLRWGAAGMLVAQALTGAIFLVNATVYLWPDLKGRVRRHIVRESVRYGSGIFASHLMAGAGPLITRSLLAASASIGTVGLFALAARVTSPLTILSTAFQTAYVPEYFAARKSGTDGALRALAKVECSFWTIGVQASLAAAVIGPPALLLLTPERFHGAASLVPILALGFLGQMLYALMSPEIFYLKTRWLPPLVTSTNIVTTLVLTLLLVRPYGAFGVAWASIAGTAAGSILCALLAARRAPVPHDWFSLGRTLIVSSASLLLASFVAPRLPAEAVALGVAVVALNAVILFVLGDPLMRRVVTEVQSRVMVRAEAVK